MIIDSRLRPPYKGFLDNWMFDAEYIPEYAKLFGSYMDESARTRSMDLLFQDMDELGVTYGMVQGRSGAGMNVPNEQVKELVDTYPDRFLGVAFLDPGKGLDYCIEEIENYVINGPFVGIAMEPGTASDGVSRNIDHKDLYPIYEKCQENNITVNVTYVSMGYQDSTCTMPQHVERVVKDFPKLKLLLGHSGWPWIMQTIAVVHRYRNVFLMPDMYSLRAPGWRDTVDAANYLIQDNILFGSAYPLVSLRDQINNYKTLGFRAEVMPKIMCQNAERVFGLKEYPPIRNYFAHVDIKDNENA